MKRHIYTQAAYNVWATNKMIAYLESLELSLLEKELKNSFPSLKDTVLHIYAAEVTWVFRMQGNPPKVWPGDSFAGSTIEVLEVWKKSSQDLNQYVLDQDEDKLTEEITFNTFEGNLYINTREQILFHVFNHSSYHRGQLVTMFKQLGIAYAPSTDMIDFYPRTSKLELG